MGGRSLIIQVDVSKEYILSALQNRRPFFQKILGVGRTPSIGSESSIDLSNKAFASQMKKHFISYINTQCKHPSDATKGILDYLGFGLEVCLGGRRRSNIDSIAWRWSLTFHFSGCAGMCEVSALVAYHWAVKWVYEDSSLEKLLQPIGISLHPMESDYDEGDLEIFAPANDAGYALYIPNPEYIESDDERFKLHFDIDTAYVESKKDKGLKMLKSVEKEYDSIMRDAKCRCQLCFSGS